MMIYDILGWILLLGGGFFLIVGGIGLLRLPDFYTRLHAAGITDTLGAGLLLLGLMVQAGPTLVTIKLILIGVFLLFTSPTATHAVANAAFVAGLKPRLAKAFLDRGDDQQGDQSSKT
ncbi:MAG: monovalent cation/H(+) antiporter subunit G [Alphaproteobacteria bacterium]